MASRRRTRIEATDDWQQLQLQLDWSEQGRYELIRPVVVFGHSPVERAEQTGTSARTIYRKVSRFDELGMQSLFEAEPVQAWPQLWGSCSISLTPIWPAGGPTPEAARGLGSGIAGSAGPSSAVTFLHPRRCGCLS